MSKLCTKNIFKEDQRIALSASPELVELLTQVLAEAAQNVEDGRDVAQSKAAATAVARLVAEACKSEQPRTIFGGANFYESLVRHLIQSTHYLEDDSKGNTYDERLTVQVLRALANLCYENESNRDFLYEVPKGIAAVTLCLKSTEASILHTVCGGLLNISMDNEPIQVEVIASQGLKYLMDIISKGSQGPLASKYKPFVASAIRTLGNLIEIEQGIQELLACNGMVHLLKLLEVEHKVLLQEDSEEEQVFSSLEILEALAAALETIGENGSIQREVVEEDLLDILLNFVDQPPLVHINQADDDEIDYHEIRKNISKIVTLVTMHGKFFN
ncbi:armadillo-type protein [Chytridium lagenaria]|nr:armadillo-type protein [Chytridium lagenaria]